MIKEILSSVKSQKDVSNAIPAFHLLREFRFVSCIFFSSTSLSSLLPLLAIHSAESTHQSTLACLKATKWKKSTCSNITSFAVKYTLFALADWLQAAAAAAAGAHVYASNNIAQKCT